MASDSISARPMIIAVWMRAAAPGCRPMASPAAATALPCPSPHSPDAIAIPRPAAMTANGPIHPPPVAAPSAANASPGTPSPAMPARISERRTNASSLSCGLLVVLRLVPLDGPRDVQHRQHHEDERLEERHQDLQRIDEPDREGDHQHAAEAAEDHAGGAARQRPTDEPVQPHEEEHYGEQDVAAQHIAEEP